MFYRICSAVCTSVRCDLHIYFRRWFDSWSSRAEDGFQAFDLLSVAPVCLGGRLGRTPSDLCTPSLAGSDSTLIVHPSGVGKLVAISRRVGGYCWIVRSAKCADRKTADVKTMQSLAQATLYLVSCDFARAALAVSITWGLKAPNECWFLPVLHDRFDFGNFPMSIVGMLFANLSWVQIHLNEFYFTVWLFFGWVCDAQDNCWLYEGVKVTVRFFVCKPYG